MVSREERGDGATLCKARGVEGGGGILARLVVFRVFVGTWRRNFVPKCTCWALGKLATTFFAFLYCNTTDSSFVARRGNGKGGGSPLSQRLGVL